MTRRKRRYALSTLDLEEIPLFRKPPTIYTNIRDGFFKLFKWLKRSRKISIRGSRKRKSVITERSGRNIRIVRHKPGENLVAPLPTIINAVFNGKYDLNQKKFNIDQKDFVGWKRLERESINLVLVVDLSQSTFPFINVFAEIINSLARYFRLHQDRIGLISLQGTQAKTMNHPTINYRIITKNLLQLKIHGETPLADGLLKAITMVKLEKYRKPGAKSLVILLSDCYPEPLTGQFFSLFDEPAYRETIRIASVYRKNRIPLLVINPSFKSQTKAEYLSGEKLSNMIANESGGKLIKIYSQQESTLEKPSTAVASQHEIKKIIYGIETILGSKITEGLERY